MKSKVKKIDPSRLKNIALWYLERFGGTRHRVQQALKKRIITAEIEHGKEPKAEQWVQDVLNDLESLGYINDEAFADARVRRGQRQGKSTKLIELDLKKAGVSDSVGQRALETLKVSGSEADLEAARIYVTRHKLGHLRAEPNIFKNKDLAKLARRGFSYEIARRALKGNVS